MSRLVRAGGVVCATCRRNVSRLVSALAFTSVFVGASETRAEDMLQLILDYHRQECAESAPVFYGIDSDLEAAEYAAASEGQTPELILGDDIIYDLPLGPSGDIATVFYRDFYCSTGPLGGCGTGGCGFYAIVDELIFKRLTGFPPGAAVLNGRGVLLIPVHGSGCIDTDGNDVPGAGGGGCHVVATWNPLDRSFNSVRGELRLATAPNSYAPSPSR